MSQIHFLADKLKNEPFEEINFFSRDSVSHPRQGWRDLIQRILDNELNILQLDRDSNGFQRYLYQLTNEYKIEENERIYKVHNLSLLWLPSRETIRSISIRVGSILRYSTIKIHMAHIMTLPSFVKDQTERERNKSLTQKRVTIITSPKWRPSIDERHYSSLDSRTKISLPPNQRSSDDLRQIIINTQCKNSYQDEPLSSSLIRKRHQNSVVNIHDDNHLSRLSLRSISYGFGLGTKTWKTIHNQKQINSSPNYRLPANKIELDQNQQEIIRRTSSLKKTDINLPK